MTKWRCKGCNYVYDGEEPPRICPKCGAPKEMFEKIGDEKAEFIEKARLTNEMHMAIASMYKKIQKWANTIKDENLDPNCVKIAERVLRDTNETIQSIKAELQSHVNKGKWG